ncbi:MAG: phosphotransferase [Planctomycetaceae bacterium]|nr:phosphotransferase [Planctomycetaceae bacterium]
MSEEWDSVWARYGEQLRCRSSEPVRPFEGLSGAQVWRFTSEARGICALRRWPQDHPTGKKLEEIFSALTMAAKRGCDFVTIPFSALDGRPYVRHENHLWQIEPWKPGAPVAAPSDEQLRRAFACLAQFHFAVRDVETRRPTRSVSPAVTRRLDVLADCTAARFDAIRAFAHERQSELQAAVAADLDDYLRIFRKLSPAVEQLLLLCSRREVLLQTVIGDIHSEHVLFDGERVSGIIDFGALTTDSVALDLARLVASYCGDDEARQQLALEAYEQAAAEYSRSAGLIAGGELAIDERVLIEAFDKSGALLAPFRWLTWIFIERRGFAHDGRVVARWRELMRRLRRMSET